MDTKDLEVHTDALVADLVINQKIQEEVLDAVGKDTTADVVIQAYENALYEEKGLVSPMMFAYLQNTNIQLLKAISKLTENMSMILKNTQEIKNEIRSLKEQKHSEEPISVVTPRCFTKIDKKKGYSNSLKQSYSELEIFKTKESDTEGEEQDIPPRKLGEKNWAYTIRLKKMGFNEKEIKRTLEATSESKNEVRDNKEISSSKSRKGMVDLSIEKSQSLSKYIKSKTVPEAEDLKKLILEDTNDRAKQMKLKSYLSRNYSTMKEIQRFPLEEIYKMPLEGP